MNRRDFLKAGSCALAGLSLAGSNIGWRMRPGVAGTSGGNWRFGVMADTQWRVVSDPANPGTCAVGIIEALNRRFIGHGVQFVVQVGDLVDRESWTSLGTGIAERTLAYRAAAAQSLYDAGIGFFPLRGNHEESRVAAEELPVLFPQTIGEGPHLFGVGNVIASDKPGLCGLSYAFDFGNVRIVMVDQFTRRDGTGSTHNNVLDQLDWMEASLAGRKPGTHAFVMAHKNLSGQNHTDCLTGANPAANPDGRNRFIRMIQTHRVGYCIGGHDHMHHRSIVSSPDRAARAEQIICASNSYKFYLPKATPNDPDEKVIAHERFTIGYYIFTVDGPRVTVDYYSSSHGQDYGDADLAATPEGMRFYLRERFGYSLNGRQFTVADHDSYSLVRDSFDGTDMSILDGMNAGATDNTDFAGRNPVKTVKTGWGPRPPGAASAVLTLWGMAERLSLFDEALSGRLPDSAGPAHCDTYTLSMSYDAPGADSAALASGNFGLVARDRLGHWVNAVELNHGGGRKFVLGAAKPGSPLGTCGVDPSSRRAWAVINHEGDFVVR